MKKFHYVHPKQKGVRAEEQKGPAMALPRHLQIVTRDNIFFLPQSYGAFQQTASKYIQEIIMQQLWKTRISRFQRYGGNQQR